VKETAEEEKTRKEEMNGQISSIDKELGELRTSVQQDLGCSRLSSAIYQGEDGEASPEGA